MYNHRANTKNEFRASEWSNEGGNLKDDALTDIREKASNLLDALHKYECSAWSIPYVVRLLSKIASCRTLAPLTGADWEWSYIGDGVSQNIRCPHVFKQVDLFDGQAYDARAVVFYDWVEHPADTHKDGIADIRRYQSQYTSADSLRVITFPYFPKTVYVETPSSKKGNGLEQIPAGD